MKTDFRCIKRAWIRDPDAPPGKPALGRLSCPCGNAPLSRFHPDQGNVVCSCGIVYTWDGYIVSRPTDIPKRHPERLTETQLRYRGELARQVANGANVPFSLFL